MSDPIGQIHEHDNQAWFHPWEYLPDVGHNQRSIIQRAEGIHVFDEHGQRLIDGPGGMWCMQIGYGRKEMAEAIAEQALRMPYMNPFSLTSEAPTRLAAKLAELAPGDLKRVFLTTGGSTAVDTALRFVHFYNNLKGRPGKKHIISREHAYHGSTYLGATVTGKDRDRNWFDINTGLSHFLPSVNPAGRPAGMSLQAFCDARVADLENKILELGADKVGAFIAEPIQASGGVIVPPEGYLKRCWEICRRHDVLFIADEVVTGFGRLGHWFASEAVFGIQPDLITCAKGLTSGYLPLGAMLLSERLFQEVSGSNANGASFGHGFTYSGHPVCCAAALKSIEIIEREQLLQHVRALSPHFLERLHALREIPLVFDTRGMGLVGCVECRVRPLVESGMDGSELYAFETELGMRIDRHCHELGLMVRPLTNLCVFSPPLVIQRDEVDQMLDILHEAILRTQRELELELGLKLS
ncbi:aminotransferase [Metapseudomonas resinovorans]|uniref:Putative aminotransferase n=1 Tax=Metapseudomonas resinovorans NBRC 106553 TaxID=1245471 RepID=S6AVZ6_METRE|nr:aminotransferase [Pseudomonas resinovorans]BAN50458.1 putative aminotransferase [Pseudomonas resinovorans NBRC 106553]